MPPTQVAGSPNFAGKGLRLGEIEYLAPSPTGKTLMELRSHSGLFDTRGLVHLQSTVLNVTVKTEGDHSPSACAVHWVEHDPVVYRGLAGTIFD